MPEVFRVSHSQDSDLQKYNTYPFIWRLKAAEQKRSIVLLEVYRNIMTRPTWTGARMKDSGTNNFQKNRHTLNIREA